MAWCAKLQRTIVGCLRSLLEFIEQSPWPWQCQPTTVLALTVGKPTTANRSGTGASCRSSSSPCFYGEKTVIIISLCYVTISLYCVIVTLLVSRTTIISLHNVVFSIRCVPPSSSPSACGEWRPCMWPAVALGVPHTASLCECPAAASWVHCAVALGKAVTLGRAMLTGSMSLMCQRLLPLLTIAGMGKVPPLSLRLSPYWVLRLKHNVEQKRKESQYVDGWMDGWKHAGWGSSTLVQSSLHSLNFHPFLLAAPGSLP